MQPKQTPHLSENMSKPTSSFFKSQTKTTSAPQSQNSPRTFNFEKYQQSNPGEMDAGRSHLEFTSKLPAITDLINLKTKYFHNVLHKLMNSNQGFGSFNQLNYSKPHQIFTKS